jgi:glyoxylase-like metal-dependent hydrolase (beta-lactamase superfamily II)/rhodanese-related sulfurtransferase
MIIEQIYTGCLAHGAYYIQSKGEAAIIDPLREVEPYLKRAEKNGAKIKYVFETHFHADFVSGHLDLAQKTGAQIVYGPSAAPSFAATIAADDQEFALGDVRIRVLHTPGHTLESSCFLLLNADGQPEAIFTGDTLFIGDVGRPDLAQRGEITMEVLAGMLYDSIQRKLMPLPDELVIYPGHGAGSACGKNMSKETSDTLGHQKQVNYALRAESKEQFVREVTDGLLPPPYYFPQNAVMNKRGYEHLETVMDRGLTALSPEAFELVVNEEGALVLDTRAPQVFKDGFVPNSINIGVDGDFAPWVGTLITDIRQPLVLVTEPGREEEVITRLSRVGYDRTLGYLAGGIGAWQAAGKPLDTIESIPAHEFAERLANQTLVVRDVRKQSEYASEHVLGAENVPLAYLSDHMVEFSKTEANYIHCAGGYRSMIACSILKARGYDNVVDVAGGFKAIAETSVPKTDYVCPSTL